MSAQTHTQQTGSQGSIDDTLSPQQFYDLIMAEIEPELVSTQVPLLDEKYKDETPQQAAERTERYNRAFEKFQQVASQVMSTMDAQTDAERTRILKKGKKKMKAEEAAEISAIEQSFNDA